MNYHIHTTRKSIIKEKIQMCDKFSLFTVYFKKIFLVLEITSIEILLMK